MAAMFIRRVVAIGALAISCASLGCDRESSSSNSESERRSGADEAGGDGDGADAPAKTKARPAPSGTSELYVDGFYRSEGGGVVLSIPPEFATHGTIELEDLDGKRRLVGKTDGGAVTMFANILPSGDYTTEAAAEKLRDTWVAGIRDSVDLSKLPLAKTNDSLAAGRVRTYRYGPAANGAVATIAVIADERDAVLYLFMGPAREVDRLVATAIAGARVGSKVPQLGDRSPGRSLQGTFATELEATDGKLVARWLTFDARGYAHDYALHDDATLDMSAMVQGATVDKWRAFAYEVQGDALTLKPIHSFGSPRKHTLKGSAEQLEIDGTAYYLVDGRIADGTTFEGEWEFYSGSSVGHVGGDYMSSSTTKTFVFGPGDKVSFSGGTMVLGSTTDEVGLMDSRLSGYVDSGTWKGTYVVKDERLIIETSDGVTITRPLAAVFMEGDVTAKNAIAIAGAVYLEQD